MHLNLKPLKRHSLAIDTDIAALLVLWNNAVGSDFLVINVIDIKKGVVFHRLKRLDCAVAGQVAADADVPDLVPDVRFDGEVVSHETGEDDTPSGA